MLVNIVKMLYFQLSDLHKQSIQQSLPQIGLALPAGQFFEPANQLVTVANLLSTSGCLRQRNVR